MEAGGPDGDEANMVILDRSCRTRRIMRYIKVMVFEQRSFSCKATTDKLGGRQGMSPIRILPALDRLLIEAKKIRDL